MAAPMPAACPDCAQPVDLEMIRRAPSPLFPRCARHEAIWVQMVRIEVNERMLTEHRATLAALLAPRLRVLAGGRA
jgi:hypothetical protein